MKTSRAYALAAATLIVGFFVARWCAAQPSNRPATRGPTTYELGESQQLGSLVTFLKETKQTNALRRLNDYVYASLASQHEVDLRWGLEILQSLRDGRTNQAYNLLEERLDADIIGFAMSYHQLPPAAREQPDLQALGRARDYRATYPFKSRAQIFNDQVADAFKILDERTK